MIRVIPTILTNNPADYAKKLKTLEKLSDWIQVDIMDGKFVPEKSIRVSDIKNIKSKAQLEFHLMVKSPSQYFTDLKELGAKRVIFQIEGSSNPQSDLEWLKNNKIDAGLALKLETPIENIKPYQKFLDVVLLLAVVPGAQGRKFDEAVLEKIRTLKVSQPNFLISIDGGMTPETAPLAVKAAADIIDVGSYLFKDDKLSKRWQNIKSAVNKSIWPDYDYAKIN